MTAQKDLGPLKAAVFLTSLAGVLLQVSLTRLYAVILWYHFVFLVISVSILGLGVGASLFSLSPLRQRLEKNGSTELARYALLFGIAVPISVILTLIYPFTDTIIGYIAIIFIPFVFAGLFSAGVFHSFSENSQHLYFADLVGAGLGSIFIIPVLSRVGAINAAMLIGALPLMASFLIYHQKQDQRRRLSLVCLGLILLVGLFNISGDFIDIQLGLRYAAGKTMFDQLRSGDYKIVSTKWSSFARTDVVQGPDDQDKLIYTDGGAGSVMIKFDGQTSQIQYLKQDPSYFPFSWGNSEKVLILGAGGGKDVLLALLAGSTDITAVEINSSIVKVMEEFKDFNGNLYGREEVTVVEGDGRNFVEQDNNFYDLIYLPLVYTQSAEGVGFALAENYIFTVEAFNSYLDRLAPRGRVAFLLHDTLDFTKAMTMAYKVFEQRGLSPSEAAERMAIAYRPFQGYGLMYPTLVMANEPFNTQELTSLESGIANIGMLGIHVPGRIYPDLVKPLLSGEQSLKQFVNEIAFDAAPATDNSPFFYKTERGLPTSLRTLLVVVTAAVIATITYASLRVRKSSKHLKGSRLKWWMIISCSGLGVGFMLLEVALIQKLILVFGNPTFALAGVLFLLLISGGLGSLYSSRFEDESLAKVIGGAASLTAVLGMIYSIGLSSFVRALIGATLIQQMAGTALLVAPLGFLMGIPFSTSLRLLGLYDPNSIALAWGINGITSVLGSTMAVASAMSAGFSAVFAIGSISYAVVALAAYYGFIHGKSMKKAPTKIR